MAESDESGRPALLERRAGTWVALLTLFALALKLATLDFGLPYSQEPDPHILGQVEALSKESVTDSDIYYSSIYPHLLARAAMLAGAKPVSGAGPDASLERHLEAASALHERVRLVIALISVLLVPATWWIARAFLERRYALLAAAFVATSLLALQFSQQARPHAASAALIALAVAAALRLRRRGDTLSFCIAGLAAAAAVASLQNGAAVLLACFAAYLLREGTSGWRRWLDARLLIPIALLAAAVRVFWPYLFVPAPPDALERSSAPEATSSAGTFVALGLGVLLIVVGAIGAALASLARPPSKLHERASGVLVLVGAVLVWTVRNETLQIAWQTIDLKHFHGQGLPTLAASVWYYEPAVLVMSIAGVGAWLFARGAPGERSQESVKDLLVVLSFALVYLVVIALYAITQQRFALPLLPFTAALSAYAIRAIARKMGPRAAAAVAVIALAVPATACLGYTGMRLRPHTQAQLATWIRAHVDREHERVAIHPQYDVPLARAAADLGPKSVTFSPWFQYQTRYLDPRWGGERWGLEALYSDRSRWPGILRDPDAYVASLQADFAVVPGGTGQVATPLVVAVREALGRAGELVLELPAEERPPVSGFSGLDTPHFTWFVWTARWFGPQLEVYDLRRRKSAEK
jgi:hypothetical protein